MRLLAAGLALAVSATAAAADFKWEIPDVVADVDVPGTMLATGVPVKLHAVVSKRRYEDVATEVVKSFRKQGLYIAPDSHQPQLTREPQLTGLDPVKMISYTVILQPNKDGTTTVILGVILAFRSIRNPWPVWLSLILGILLPVALLWLGHKR